MSNLYIGIDISAEKDWTCYGIPIPLYNEIVKRVKEEVIAHFEKEGKITHQKPVTKDRMTRMIDKILDNTK